MSKKYLIETEEVNEETFWHHMDAKEVEVLSKHEIIEMQNFGLKKTSLPDYLKANNYLIVKIVE